MNYQIIYIRLFFKDWKMIRAITFVLFFSFFKVDLFSQTLLTNLEVFDFEVGTSIQYKQNIVTFLDNFPPSPNISIMNRLRNDSIISKILIPGGQAVSYSTKRSSSLNGDIGTDTTLELQYPYNNEPVKCPFFQTSIAQFDTLELIGQPGNISATGFKLSNGFDSINQIEIQTVLFIKGLGGPFLLSGQNNDGIGISVYTGSFQLSKNGQPPIPIVFSLTQTVLQKSTLSVHPNPFKNQIQLPESSMGSKYQIFNLQGRNVLNGTLQDSNLDLSKLKSGLYQIQIFSTEKGTRKMAKIIKE